MPPESTTDARQDDSLVSSENGVEEHPVESTENGPMPQAAAVAKPPPPPPPPETNGGDVSESSQHFIQSQGRKALHDFFFVKKPGVSSPHRTGPRSKLQSQSTIPPPSVSTSGAATAMRTPTSKSMSGRPDPSPSPRQQRTDGNGTSPAASTTISPSRIAQDPTVVEQERQDREYVANFWNVYDDVIILSLFTQIGILCRLGMANWFKIFDGVFHSQSALFTNLPLNCCSCFLMGLLCSGESLMQIIGTRFTPPRLQQDLHREADSERDTLTPVREARRRTLFVDDDHEDSHFEEDEEEMTVSTGHTPDRKGHRWRGLGRRLKRNRAGGRRLRNSARIISWKPKRQNFQNDLRESQLLALERRIRMSTCLVLFPIKKEDVDVVEDYFRDGYQKTNDDSHLVSPDRLYPSEGGTNRSMGLSPGSSFGYIEEMTLCPDDHELSLDETFDNGTERQTNCKLDFDNRSLESDVLPDEEFQDEILSETDSTRRTKVVNSTGKRDKNAVSPETRVSPRSTVSPMVGQPYSSRRVLKTRRYGQISTDDEVDYGSQELPDLDQIITNVATDVSQKISRIKRVRLVDGWDVGTTPDEKSEDLMLGLRDGLCGALSSFSSWMSAMVNLIRGGNIGQAFVGLVLGIQLPIVAYRFGQHVAVYIFIWRCRRENKRDDRRGYGIRLNMDDDFLESDDGDCPEVIDQSIDSGDNSTQSQRNKNKIPVTVDEVDDSETPSVRAIITAIFIMCLVAQTTSLSFFYEPESRLVALSLLFSPFGVLMRWRLVKLNTFWPSFPIGTFICNIGACALSGSLGSVLAGNPGPRERITLVAVIAGLGGTLSSVAGFIVEVLAGVDPILFRMDGAYYAVCSLGWGMLVSFLFTASVDWADSVE